MFLYRVEIKNKFGEYEGPYRNYHTDYDSGSKLDIYNLSYNLLSDFSPSPWSDSLLSKKWRNRSYRYGTSDYFFGFINLYSVYEWFNDDLLRSEMNTHGYYLTKYRINKKLIIEGTKQIVFQKDKATIMDRIIFPSELDSAVSHFGVK